MKNRVISMLIAFAIVISALPLYSVNSSEQENSSVLPVSDNYSLGDIDGNGEVSIFDALEILKHLVGMDGAIQNGNADISPENARLAAKITQDSRDNDTISIFDALEILKKLVGMPNIIDEFIPPNPPKLYSVTDIDLLSADTVAIEVTAENAAEDECYLEVRILSDVTGISFDWDGGSELANGKTRVYDADKEFISVTVSQTLPDYFVAVAVITDNNGSELCDPYTFIEYTQAYEQFSDKDIHDFDENLVLNLDEIDDNNFVVLTDEIVQINEGENGSNLLDISRIDENIYTFNNADGAIMGLKIGDRISVVSDDGVNIHLIEVKSIVIDGSTVTITAEEDYLTEDFFEFMKIDWNGAMGKASLNMSDADEGVEYIEDPDDPRLDFDIENLPEYGYAPALERIEYNGFVNPPLNKTIDLIDIDGSKGANLNFIINKGTDNANISGTVTGGIESAVKIRYDAKLFGEDYFYANFSITATVVAKASITLKVEHNSKKDKVYDELYLGEITFPFGITGFAAAAKLTFPLDWEIEASGNATAKVVAESGFLYESKSGYQPIVNRDFESSVNIQGKARVAIGPKIEFSVEFLKNVVKAEIGVHAGVELNGEAVYYVAGNASNKCACEICVKGNLNKFAKAGFKLTYSVGVFKGSAVDITLAEYRQHLDYFYVSLKSPINSTFAGRTRLGKGDCPNKSTSPVTTTSNDVTTAPSNTTAFSTEPTNPVTHEIIQFGGYDWRVLERQGNRVLIISDRVLEKRVYHKNSKDITWADSDIRSYLNNEFYNSFSAADRARINEVTLKNQDNQWFGTPGGVDTQDRIFLLSLEEVVKYFGDSGQLQNGNPNNPWYISDEYNDSRIVYDMYGYSAWWLRSPGNSSIHAPFVGISGEVSVIGTYVDIYAYGVRPALWLTM